MRQNRAARIIFVEDNPAHTMLAEHALAHEGFISTNIKFFSSGDGALQYLQEHIKTPPDVIFIDLKLKNSIIQGDDIAKYMLAHDIFSQTEICIMSAAYMTREKENEYAKTNVRFFLKKPLITEQLETVIRESKRLKKLIVVIDSLVAA